MPGASESTVRVINVNANWTAGPDGKDGLLELLVVTEDDERHTLTPTALDAPVLLAMVAASPVLLWDPANRTLIGANIVGDWLPAHWTAKSDRADPDQVSEGPVSTSGAPAS